MTPILAHAVGVASPHGHALLAIGTAAVIVGSGALVVIGFRLEDRARIDDHRWVRRSVGLRILAAALSLGAAAIHFSVVGVHAVIDPVEGALFALAAWLQVAVAVAVLLAPARPGLVVLAAVNAAAAGAWLWSRVLGLPFGVDAWIPQSIAPADGLATTFEVLAVAAALLAVAAARRSDERTARLSSAVTYVGAAVLAIAVATTVVLVGYPAEDHAEAPSGSVRLP